MSVDLSNKKVIQIGYTVPGKNNLRIIGGRWRSRRIQFIDSPKIRPTPDRVRETLFNWLAAYIKNASCLDLFAGSGALGFEAMSRGAEEVVLVEDDARIAAMLNEQKQQFNAQVFEVKCQSALTYIQTVKRQFDIIFLDPPFDSNLLSKVIPVIIKHRLLSDNGLLYVESASQQKDGNSRNAAASVSPEAWSELLLENLSCVREKVSGEVHYALYKWTI